MEDAIRFFQCNRGIIEVVPLQTYSSALVFAPECSIIRQEFGRNVHQGIPLVFNRPNTWGAYTHTLLGHRDEVTSLAFSSTPRLLLSNSMDGTARIWEMKTGNCQQILHFGTRHFEVAISPDSKKVASWDSTYIYIWNTDTGEKIHTLYGNGKYFLSIAFASDSKMVASVCQNKTVWIWCTDTGKHLRTLQCHEEEGTNSWINISFSDDLRYVVAASNTATTVWEFETSQEICNLTQQEKHTCYAVAFSPNSKLLASAHKSSYELSKHFPHGGVSYIDVWCIATGSKLKTCHTELQSAFLRELAFSSNTELVVPTMQGLCHWRFQSSSVFDHETSVTKFQILSSIALSFDMKFLAGSERRNNTISIWNLNSSDNNADALNEYGTSTRDINRVVISPDSSLAALSSSDRAVTLWRTDTGQRCQTFTGHSYEVTAINFSHDSSVMITSDRKRTLRFWQTATGECINVLSVLEINDANDSSNWSKALSKIAVSPDLGILVGGCIEELFVLQKFNETEYKCIAQYPAPQKGERVMNVEHIAASLHSAFVSWVIDDEYRFMLEHWRIDTGESVKLRVGHKYRSISHQEKYNGFLIPTYSYWGQMPTKDQCSWITKNEEWLIWIPKEFRSWRWDSSGSILAIGLNSETLLIMDFSRQPNAVACEDGEIKSSKRKRRESSLGITTEKRFQEQENI